MSTEQRVASDSHGPDQLYPKELMMLASQRMQQHAELRRPPAA